MEQPLAPVDLDFSDFDAIDEVALDVEEDYAPLQPVSTSAVHVTGRAPGVVPPGQQRPYSRFGAGAAGEMPAPQVLPLNPKPAYGLVGVPDEAVTTRDVKVFALGATIGVLLTSVLSWMGRRSARP